MRSQLNLFSWCLLMIAATASNYEHHNGDPILTTYNRDTNGTRHMTFHTGEENSRDANGGKFDTIDDTFDTATTDAIDDTFDTATTDAIDDTFDTATTDAIDDTFDTATTDTIDDTFDTATTDAINDTFDTATTDTIDDTYGTGTTDAIDDTFYTDPTDFPEGKTKAPDTSDISNGTHKASLHFTDFPIFNKAVGQKIESTLKEMKENFSALKEYNLLWTYFVSEPFEGKRYLASLMDDRFSLDWGNTMCRMDNGYLLELDSRKEYDFVVNFLDISRIHFFLVGANDVEQRGHFVNYNSGRELNITLFPWQHETPTNHPRRQNCVMIRLFFSRHQLRTTRCDNRMRYVCEVPA